MRDDNIALDDNLMRKLKTGVANGRNPFTGNDGEVARRAYLDFLSARGMADTPDSRRVFVELLSERKTRLSNSGQPNLGVEGEKRFYADAALARLRARSTRKGPIELAPQDRWMISALSDPSVKLTAADRALLSRTQWHDNGLRRNLGEWAAKQAAASEPQPGIGQPFSTWLNLADVFHGDPQRNAYVMAAKHAGYTDAEIDLALEYYKSHGITSLFVDRGQADQPPIARRDQVQPVNFGGQDFVLFTMSKEGAELLRDARYARQHGFDSVDAYRDDFNNTWSDMVGSAGAKVLEYEQAIAKSFGLDEAPILGPLTRGMYDVTSDLTLAGSNFAQFIQSFEHFFVRISGDEELLRYYRSISPRAEQNSTEMRSTYPLEEKRPGDQFIRVLTASVPKILSGPAAPYYSAALHANKPLDTVAAVMIMDGLSLPLGAAAGRLGTGVSGLASKRLEKVVEDKFVQETVQQLISRGTAGATNATASVAMTATLEPTRTDAERAKMTDAQKAEESQAYVRNASFAFVLAMLMPGAHRKQDFATLSKPGAQLEGPLLRTPLPKGGGRYYGMVEVTEGSKTRMEMIEVNPLSPKARQLIEAGRVQDAQPGDVNLARALVETRYGRLPAEARAELSKAVKQHAYEQTLAEAKTGALASRSAGAGSPPGQLQKAPVPVNTKTPEPANMTAAPPAAAKTTAPPALATTPEGYLLDTNIFNAAADGHIPLEELRGVRLASTHVQLDEMAVTKTPDRATALLSVFNQIGPDSVSTTSTNLGVSALGRSRLSGEGGLFEKMLARLEELDKASKKKAKNESVNRRRDILIAETAVRDGLTLVSNDQNLRQVTQEFGGTAIDLAAFREKVKAPKPAIAMAAVATASPKTAAATASLRPTTATEPTAPKSPLPPEGAAGGPTRGDPPAAGEPKSVHERYEAMMRGEITPERYALETADEVAREVEWYARNDEDFGACTRAALDTSLKLYRRRVPHNLAVYDAYHNGVFLGRHAVVELPGGQVVTYGRVFKSMADLEESRGRTYTVELRGDLKEYVARQKDKTRSGTGIASYPHQEYPEMFPFEPYRRMVPSEQHPQMVPFERGKVSAGSQVQYRGEEFTLVQYDRATGKPILFQKGRGKDWTKLYDNVTEAQLKAKYDEIIVDGKKMWIDKNRAHIYSAADMGNGTFLVGPDWQYVLWDEAREPGALTIGAPKS
jgi:hypothetical protein